jgi:HSP20 family protein
MSTLRFLDPTFGTDLDTALRRIIPPHLFEHEHPPQMLIDVREQPGAFVVQADLPGVRKEDIQVHVDGNTVRIEAEARSLGEAAEGERLLRGERHVGPLMRAFSLPQQVDDARVQARYVDGVLTLHLPKKPGTNTRSIAIE